MKKKIVFLPLDERPCNYYFPTALYGGEYDIAVPPMEIMGVKKKPAPAEKIAQWLLTSACGADGLIIAVDTLLYGGIIPSRLHHLTEKEILSRLDILRKIRKLAPDVKISAFSLIMRCPQYSYNDEEPDYYGEFGREIFLKGEALHKKELGLLTQEDISAIPAIEAKIRPEDYKDYMDRRALNCKANLAVIDLLKEGVIDFLLIPQDDSAVYGHTAKDQALIRQYIKDNELQSRCYMYPGADEVGLTLLARMLNSFHNKRPKAYVMYSSHRGAEIVPSFEDRPLGETIKYQLLAAGCIRWDNPDTADLIVAINTPSRQMREAAHSGACTEYDTERTIIEFCELAEEFIALGKPVIIGDVAYANGGDLELASIFNQKKLFMKLAGYAGWNTSSNTLGTCISQGVKFFYDGVTKHHNDFLALRLVEDFGYCSKVRKHVKYDVIPALGFDGFNVGEQRGEVAAIVKKELEEFISEKLPSVAGNIKILDCYMPWIRMFEVGLKVEYKNMGEKK